jgi:hypothetical protein
VMRHMVRCAVTAFSFVIGISVARGLWEQAVRAALPRFAGAAGAGAPHRGSPDG